MSWYFSKEARKAKTVMEIPAYPHFAIVESRDVSVSDGWDGTSRETTFVYYYFTEEAAWRKEVEALYTADPVRKDIRAFQVGPTMPKVKHEVKF